MISSTMREIPASSLTSREKEILLLVAQGHPNKTIAKMLWLSEKTVRNHITHILSKLRLQRRTQLVCYAWQVGWISNNKQSEVPPPQSSEYLGVGDMSHFCRASRKMGRLASDRDAKAS